jgi:hypothetical protein
MYVREHILEQFYNKVTMHTCLRIRGFMNELWHKVCIPVTEFDAYLRLLQCTENGIAWHGFGNYIPM